MAVGEQPVTRTELSSHYKQLNAVHVSPIASDWVTACTAPETADNSGSSIVNPALITRDTQNVVKSNGFGNSLQVRLRYDDGLTSITNPVVQIFGKDGNGLWQKLLDKSGSHELTLTTAASTDLTDATDCYTDPVEVDMAGCTEFLAAVKTALAGTGTVNTSLLQARTVSREVRPPVAISSFTAGETHLGEVGGNSINFKPTITVSASPDYTSGDCIGGKITLTNICRASGAAVVLTSLTITDAADQKPEGQIIIFDADPSSSTLTDNAAFVLHASDIAKVLHRIPVVTADYVTMNSGKAIATLNGLNRVCDPASGQTLYMAFVTTTAANLAATTDIGMVLSVLRD